MTEKTSRRRKTGTSPSKVKKKKSLKTKETKISELVTRNLAAIYRPKNLDGFVGQDEAVTKLKGWIKKKQFPQTILIEGETGAGKTTLAKMIARYVNCETMSACGKCGFCRYEKEMPDVFYANAGEVSGVDDMRRLIKTTQFAPKYRRKIYILDEVHLLSQKALESLLIPLEEPSEKTIWILCTTELDKIKATIRNRCQALRLRPVDPDSIVKRLSFILENEGFPVKKKSPIEDALYTIADYSEGQVRYAISLMDELISAVNSGDAEFDDKSVETIRSQASGASMDKLAVSLFMYIIDQDLEKIICIIEKSGDAMGLLRKVGWFTDWFIKYSAGAIKFVPYIGKVYFDAKKALEKKNGTKINVSLALALKVANCLQEVEHTVLTVPAIQAQRYLYLQLSELVIDDVFQELVGMTKKKGKK